MRRGAWVHSAICGMILMLAFGLSGCWNPFSPGGDHHDGHSNHDRKTLDHLLEFFAGAYEEKDIEQYKESLDEHYEFEFDPKDYDAAGVNAEKPYWGKTEDWPRTEKMFSSAGTKAISMDLSQKDMTWFASTFLVGETIVEGFTCRIIPVIDVTIEMAAGEEPVTKQVRKSRIMVAAIPDQNYPGLWTILKITETVIE